MLKCTLSAGVLRFSPYKRIIGKVECLHQSQSTHLTRCGLVWLRRLINFDTYMFFPQDLQELMDRSQQGIIYFSMGTVVKSSSIPKETILKLIQIFGSLKMTVLWKLDDTPKGLPNNVHVRKWWPQSNILGKVIYLFLC